MRKNLLYILTIVIFSCTSSAKIFIGEEELNRAQQRDSTISMAMLEVGKKSYDNNCKNCHRLYKSTEFTTRQWNRILPEMFIKARMSNTEEMETIETYVKATCKE